MRVGLGLGLDAARVAREPLGDLVRFGVGVRIRVGAGVRVRVRVRVRRAAW